VQKWMGDDPLVAERLTSAKEAGALQIEHAAITRAVHGVKKDVWFKGEVVGEETQYSDSLLQTLLKKRLPHTYGEDAGGNTLVNYGQINVMPRAENYEEWLGMMQATDRVLIEHQKQLPNVLDAEYTPVLRPEDDPDLADLL
jgi:hypothetical protein